MKKFLKVLSLFTAITVVNFSFGQNVVMGDAGFPQSNPANCTTFGVSGTNFQDPGAGGNYTPNYNDTITFCPDLNLGTKMSISMAINAGFTFDVDGSDFIYVYDGPNTSSPLLGAHNSVLSPTGFTHQASWANPSGCLTIVFITDGAVEGTGWDASVQCGNQFQPFNSHIEAYINGSGPNALNPLDTGFVDICFGDSILFVATPNFPYSLESTGFGYSQDVNSTIDFEWNISDGQTYPNNDSIWFTPPTRNGFLVDLKLTDLFPQVSHQLCKVRVSQLPNFAGTGPVDDTVCVGESTNLIGGVTPTDTVGVDIPEGSFQLGGSFAGLTYLPDGSGQEYTTTINMSGFPPTATVTNAQDLNEVCITMEHSYLGDLEIWLECPNGTIVPLVNSYGPGAIPGGTSGGGTYLGHPYDDVGGGGPGIGWQYCFSSAFNTIGSMTSNLGNTVPVGSVPGNVPPLSAGNSIDPSDVYAPEITFATFAGCPVNGDWTIHVQDNLGTDDGYIFEWGLFFDASYFPGLGGYQNYVVSDFWSNDPTIISGQNDTLIVVQPNAPGSYNYTYNVVDDFGCSYDTTVVLFVQPLPVIFNDTLACDLNFQVSGSSSFAGGVWSSPSPNVSFSNSSAANPLITTSIPGTYSVSYVDNACNDTVTSSIIFPQYPTIFSDTSLCGFNFQIPIDSINSYGGGYWTLVNGAPGTFTPSNGILNPQLVSTTSYVYLVTYTDSICNNSTTASVTMIEPPIINAPDISCFYQETNITSSSYQGGIWTILDNPSTTYQESDSLSFINGTSNQSSNPDVQVTQPGNYTIQFTDSYCGISVTDVLTFPPYLFTDVTDTNLCIGIEFPLNAYQGPYPATYTWNTGQIGPVITVTEPGVYSVTASNECHSYTDSAVIEYYLCDIQAPNIISLSSTSGNNFWFVQSDGISDFECFIVNRWGNLIYEYNDVNSGWNGQDRSGKLVEEGVYFYHIKAKSYGGQELEKQGFITVVH